MAEIIDAEDRASQVAALEKFAGTSKGASRRDVMEVGAAQMMNAVQRVYGAQKVAVYRDENEVKRRLVAAAAVAGQQWYYRWPTKNKDGSQGWVEGPSIKLADDLVKIYGNCHVVSIPMDMGSEWLFLACFTDFETGYIRDRPFLQRKGQTAGGRMDADRARDIAFQIGASKAERNVIVHALRTWSQFCMDEARRSLLDKIERDVPGWRGKILDALQRQSIDKLRVERIVGRPADKWLAPDVAGIVACMNTIHDGMASWDDTYPPINAQTPVVETKTVDEAGSLTDDAVETTATEVTGEAEPERATQEAQTTAEPTAGPHDETTYVEYALAWIAAATDADDASAKWKGEKTLRQKCRVGPEAMSKLKTALDAKIAQLTNA